MKYGASADIGSQDNELPIKEYCQCCTENLNSDIYVNLLPTQSSYVCSVMVQFISYLVTTIPCNYDEVATILEINLLNIIEPKLKSVTFREYRGVYAIYYSFHDQIEVCLQGHVDDKRDVQLWLWELKILTMVLTHTGFSIGTIPSPLLRLTEDHNHVDISVKQQCDEINSSWEQYKQNHTNVLSMFEICCHRIKHVMYNVTRLKLEQLGLPSAVIDQMSNRKAVQSVMHELHKLHESEEYKSGYPYIASRRCYEHTY